MYTKLVKRRTPARWLAPTILVLFFMLLAVLYYHRNPMIVFFSSKSGYDNLILDAAEKHCIDPALLSAVAWHESRFDPNARGAKGEVGLMQIRPKNGAVEEWAYAHHVDPPLDGLLFVPELNLEIGAWYLARAIRKWAGYKSQIELALSEYNAGATGMTSWIPENPQDEVTDRITIPSTRYYVRMIMDKYISNVKKREVDR